MPKRNQKVMTDEEQAIVQKGREKKARELIKEKELDEEVKLELIKKDKENLPQVLEQRTNELALALSDRSDIPYQTVYNIIAKKTLCATKNSYSNDELNIALNEFRNVVSMITETQPYFNPSINLFCAYLGISTATYKSWLQSTDETRREVIQMIDDYISDTNLTLSQQRKLDNFTTVFRAEAQHGIVRQQANVVIEHKSAVDLDEIHDRILQIRKGKVVDADFKEKK